jgi:hypothetical protein
LVIGAGGLKQHVVIVIVNTLLYVRLVLLYAMQAITILGVPNVRHQERHYNYLSMHTSRLKRGQFRSEEAHIQSKIIARDHSNYDNEYPKNTRKLQNAPPSPFAVRETWEKNTQLHKVSC